MKKLARPKRPPRSTPDTTKGPKRVPGAGGRPVPGKGKGGAKPGKGGG